jgi:hypothetical protein
LRDIELSISTGTILLVTIDSIETLFRYFFFFSRKLFKKFKKFLFNSCEDTVFTQLALAGLADIEPDPKISYSINSSIVRGVGSVSDSDSSVYYSEFSGYSSSDSSSSPSLSSL